VGVRGTDFRRRGDDRGCCSEITAWGCCGLRPGQVALGKDEGLVGSCRVDEVARGLEGWETRCRGNDEEQASKTCQ
jgi:hypothetical protein